MFDVNTLVYVILYTLYDPGEYPHAYMISYEGFNANHYTSVHGFCFFNPIHPIGNSLKKLQKPCTKVYCLVLKPPYKSHKLMAVL